MFFSALPTRLDSSHIHDHHSPLALAHLAHINSNHWQHKSLVLLFYSLLFITKLYFFYSDFGTSWTLDHGFCTVASSNKPFCHVSAVLCHSLFNHSVTPSLLPLSHQPLLLVCVTAIIIIFLGSERVFRFMVDYLAGSSAPFWLAQQLGYKTLFWSPEITHFKCIENECKIKPNKLEYLLLLKMRCSFSAKMSYESRWLLKLNADCILKLCPKSDKKGEYYWLICKFKWQ